MRIMTFNLLFDGGKNNRFPWEMRRDLVVRIIERYGPHILGTQEGMKRQLEYLRDRLAPEYAMVARGRNWDDTSQYPTLFYRADAFALLEAGEFWLSKTPEIHLSKDWGSGFPRMMSYGVFRNNSTGRDFLSLVTHLDHISDEARLEQAKIIGRWLASHSEPAVVMGDFNDKPGSVVHGILTREYRAMIDAWQALSLPESELSMTRHDGAGNPKKCRMDWILVSPDFTVLRAEIIRDNEGGLYPSDHYPCLVELKGWGSNL